jgi:ABC-type amino acid transport substrate-binding protein
MNNNSITFVEINGDVVEINESILNAVNGGKAIAVQQDDDFISYLSRDWCDLVLMQSPFPQRPKYFMLRKGNPLLPEINRAIRAQRILILRAHRKYFEYRRPSKCKEHTNKPRSLCKLS